LFYLRGSFTREAVVESARFMQLLSVTVFSIGINAVVTRIFIAMQAVRAAFFYQVGLNILLIVTILICTKYYGAYGYPYAIIIMNVVNFVTMYFICKLLVPQINYADLLSYAGLIILINAVIAAGIYFIVANVEVSGLLEIIAGFLLYLITLLILNKKYSLNKELGFIITYAKKIFF
jgi:peptidoglycan biosynthesis protein MviN/MurJ (putative lipid II flippase)